MRHLILVNIQQFTYIWRGNQGDTFATGSKLVEDTFCPLKFPAYGGAAVFFLVVALIKNSELDMSCSQFLLVIYY